jgi:hypothetical protein
MGTVDESPGNELIVVVGRCTCENTHHHHLGTHTHTRPPGVQIWLAGWLVRLQSFSILHSPSPVEGLANPHLTSLHLTSPHLTSPHLTSRARMERKVRGKCPPVQSPSDGHDLMSHAFSPPSRLHDPYDYNYGAYSLRVRPPAGVV